MSGQVQCGWLLKKGGGRLRMVHWQRRWFVLDGSQARIYKDTSSTESKKKLDLSTVLESQRYEGGEEAGAPDPFLRFDVITPDATWSLAVESVEDDVDKWIESFTRIEKKADVVASLLWCRWPNTKWTKMHLALSEDALVAYDAPTYAKELQRITIKEAKPVPQTERWMVTRQLYGIDLLCSKDLVVALALSEEEKIVWLAKLRVMVETRAYRDLRLAKSHSAAQVAAERLMSLELDEDIVTEVCKKALDTLFDQNEQIWPAKVCAELARRAAGSADTHHMIARALSGRVTWPLIAQRLDDATKALQSENQRATSVDEVLAAAMADLLTTLATRPSGAHFLDSRLAVIVQFRAAGISRLLDHLRGVAEALELKVRDEESLPSISSQEAATPKPRQPLSQRIFGKRKSSSEIFQNNLPSLHDSLDTSSHDASITTQAAAAIKALFDEYEERLLDDEARATARLKKAKKDLDNSAVPPRDAVDSFVHALQRDLLFNIVAGREDAASYRLLKGQEASFFTTLRKDPLMHNQQQDLRHHKPRRLLTRQLTNTRSVSPPPPATVQYPSEAKKEDPKAALNAMIQKKAPPEPSTDPKAALNAMIQKKAQPEPSTDPKAALNAMIQKKAQPEPSTDPKAALNAMILNKKAPTTATETAENAQPKKDPYKVFKMRLASCRDEDDRAGLIAAIEKEGLDPSKIGLQPLSEGTESKKAKPEPASLGAEPTIALKGFHWDKLDDKSAFNESWWAENQENKEREAVVRALPMIESVFAAPSVSAPAVAARKQSSLDDSTISGAMKNVFDSDRLQAAAFALRTLRARAYPALDDAAGVVSQLLDATDFDDDDDDELDRKLEELKMLEQAALPSKAEEDSNEYSKLQSALVQSLQDEERFAFEARKSVPNGDLRSEIQFARATFTLNMRIDEAMERLERKDNATEAVATSEELRLVLRLALYTGNALNHSAPARQAAGIKVSALSTLASTKATYPDGHLTTALDLVATIARDFDPEQARNLKPQLFDPLDAIKNDEPIDDVINSLQSDLNLAQKRGPKAQTLSDSIKAAIEQLKSHKAEVDKSTQHLFISFGEKATTRDPRPFFGRLLEFVNAFDAIIAKIDTREAEEDQARRQSAARKRRLLRKTTSKSDTDPYDAPDTKNLSLLAVANAAKSHSIFARVKDPYVRDARSITSFYDDEPQDTPTD